VTGDHTLRVWSSGDGTRITELLRFGERSIDLTRSEVWAWDAGLYTAYHIGPFSFRPARVWPSEGPLGPGGLDPLELARQSLDAITPSTLVQVDRSDRVAGRDCYVVALTPRTPDTLIGRIEVSIDAATRVPLGVAVFARGAGRPAISAGFSSVSFDPIAPSVYRFTPPPGAKVVQLQPPSGDSTSSGDEGRSVLSSARAKVSTDGSQGEYGRFPYGDGVRVFGHDWTTIVAIRTPPMATVAGSVAGIDLASFLPYSGPLLSVRLVARGDHDWLVYGAVRQAMLVGVERELS